MTQTRVNEPAATRGPAPAAGRPATPPVRRNSKSLPDLFNELKELVVAYFKQETVEPLKGLARFVIFGVAGSLLVGIGAVLLLLGVLRVLQEETGSTFTGNWSWAPYGITLVGAGLVAGLAVLAAGRVQKRRSKG